MRIFLQKRLDGSLAPACETSERMARKLSPGEAAEFEWKSRNTRSVQWHRRYWALCNLIYANCETVTINGKDIELRSVEHCHLILKTLAGLYDAQVTLSDGTTAVIVKSIAFDNMTADEWELAWKKITDVVFSQILPGVSSEAIEFEIAKVAT